MATQVADMSSQALLSPPEKSVIFTQELWKTYDMGSEQVHALRGVSISIERGEYVAIMGPSGSGKSTLMNLIGCLDSPSKGRYWLNRQDVSELDDDELARIRNKEIGFVFQTFKGRVSEIGDNAMVRSTGVATTQTTAGSQEAKDFKVVVTLDTPPQNLRPGLSTTAKITTATTRADTLTIPIQAVTVRQKGDLKEKPKDTRPDPMAKPSPEDKEEVQGVFVIRGKNAQFVPVKTGVTGTTDIEVKEGLSANDEIVTGSYKILRTLKPGATIKIDNEAPKKEEEEG